ncbi:uncharacterized protein HD556DRAFT_1428103 [Suillus plorans]|uniref:Uncharacterized protein n=1 Tax=Suillus plorans TaxID=116603 RepID=A0A9P7J9M1_9AGAM|nr:uncharacterized protein HD556DRAFT_1428103 [Suillus plorans]KAG1809839.1 hypothetical protein HD556DRAFT_1428103 [Suillus plorans]
MRTVHPRPLRSHKTFHQAAPAPRSPSPVHQDFDDAHLPDENRAGESFMPEADNSSVQLGPLFRTFHPHLTGLKCDINGDFINQNAPPTPQTEALPTNWTPYESHVAFETAEFLFTHNQMSAGQIDTLLDLWTATLIKHEDSPPFATHHDLYDTIDSTPLGDITWESFSMSYKGVKPADNVPPWMKATYDVWFRDPRLLIHNMLTNPDFDGEIEYTPYWDYNDNDKCCFKKNFLGNWTWMQADKIAEDPEMHGSTFVPLIVRSDKTTVSVATGHTDELTYSTKEHADDIDFRNFRRQLFYSSLANIFKSLKKYMMTPDIVRCPDSHYRRVIYGLGPYIADYPEQVLLSGIVTGWCPKCLNDRRNLDGNGLLRCREHTNLLVQELQHKQLWYEYGIVGDVVPFTNDFARADIHELLSPDLLHQIIKGTFKDHLVDWVGEYLERVHGCSCAAEIQDDINRRIAAVAPFAGLQHFPEGRGFAQWTGDDSKALMKVYLPAIKGHVPQDIIHTFSAFLDFCYIVRREALTEDDLVQLEDALHHFHQYCEVFKMTGVRLTFSLKHYSCTIRLFGAPNGLCSSITESKHIKAVKEPWRCSSRYKALGQMLMTNQCLDKIAAARSDFEACNMLHGSCVSDALQALKTQLPNRLHVNEPQHQTIEGEAAEIIDGPAAKAHVELAAKPVLGGACDIPALTLKLGLPSLPTMLHIEDPEPPASDPAMAPTFLGRISVFSSAAASFYAPSDLSGTGGMRHEHIRATTSWRGGPARNDCVFVSMNDEFSCGLDGLAVTRVLCFFSFKYWTEYLQCAIIRWFSYITDSRDPDTGMYIVAPSTNDDGTPDVSIIHIDCIFCAAHLIPLYGTNFLPREITLHDSYDVFHAFYINKYADHHAFEVA